MKIKILILLFYITSIFTNIVKAQFSIGVEPLIRVSDDKVGKTNNLNIVSHFYSDSTVYGEVGFMISLPKVIKGTSTLTAFNSSTTPFRVSIPSEQIISDYILHFGAGFFMPSKKFPTTFVVTAGLRVIFRDIKVNYLGVFDASKYDKKNTDENPYIPAALNIGFSIGLGYHIKINRSIIFPHFSLGFGSGDNRNKHPWNNFPTYGEFGIRFMLTKKEWN